MDEMIRIIRFERWSKRQVPEGRWDESPSARRGESYLNVRK